MHKSSFRLAEQRTAPLQLIRLLMITLRFVAVGVSHPKAIDLKSLADLVQRLNFDCS